ncbi:hypothetical protein BM221_005089 [Beauveria bassiana]|uniref:Protein kinase domain-containing protein n=1 Tax=Beauveria bassiana TaxID=176275 RepID=A0A2N6NML4_BEABA|nr:hypothetical protein BM221_005089 [Beauveria bassiana]
MHAHLEAHFFLSDLRPDNILLDRREREDGLVICDFEQRGNWYEWSPPEILYAQYVENIEREMQRVEAGAAAAPWRDLVALYRSVSLPHKRAVCGKVEDSNWPWFVMTAQQQEKAQVYMIGLLIYCIFEGTSNVRLNIANAYRHEDPEIQFPTFKNSPMLLRKLIQKYTAGAPEWEPYETHPSRDHSSTWPPRATRVIRNGTNLQTEASAGAESNLETEHDVLETALNWWAVELQRAKHFFTTHGETYRDVGECRPTLKEVLLDLQCLQLSELE